MIKGVGCLDLGESKGLSRVACNFHDLYSSHELHQEAHLQGQSCRGFSKWSLKSL